MKRLWLYWFALLVAGTSLAWAEPPNLRVYFVDVEGGQATLIVAPSGEVLLIDAGWDDIRDAPRIVQAARAAGVSAIDALLVTHFHRDHAGGVAGLAARIPLRAVYDHGENTENYNGSAEIMAKYRGAIQGARHRVVHPGDKLPVRGIDVRVVSSGGDWLKAPLPGAGERNAACGDRRKPDEHSENAASVGILLQFGKFRMLDLADLLWNQELDLMCPVNPIGRTDLLVISHHGKDTSNSAALVRGTHARVAIMNNSETKGGSPATFDILQGAPELKDLWQLHYSVAAERRNAPETLIANPRGACRGSGIQVIAGSDGSFRVINEGNHFQKTYGPGK